MAKAGLVAAGLALAAGAALAQSVPTEVQRVGGSVVTLHLHGFLTSEERQTLQMIAASPDALALMLGEGARDGHAAIAVAPAEGFLRDGLPVASATAIAQLPDAASVRAAALEGCDAARRAGPACVIVLEVAPR